MKNSSYWREPAEEQLADEMQVSPNKVSHIIKATQQLLRAEGKATSLLLSKIASALCASQWQLNSQRFIYQATPFIPLRNR